MYVFIGFFFFFYCFALLGWCILLGWAVKRYIFFLDFKVLEDGCLKNSKAKLCYEKQLRRALNLGEIFFH